MKKLLIIFFMLLFFAAAALAWTEEELIVGQNWTGSDTYTLAVIDTYPGGDTQYLNISTGGISGDIYLSRISMGFNDYPGHDCLFRWYLCADVDCADILGYSDITDSSLMTSRDLAQWNFSSQILLNASTQYYARMYSTDSNTCWAEWYWSNNNLITYYQIGDNADYGAAWYYVNYSTIIPPGPSGMMDEEIAFETIPDAMLYIFLLILWFAAFICACTLKGIHGERIGLLNIFQGFIGLYVGMSWFSHVSRFIGLVVLVFAVFAGIALFMSGKES